MKIETASKMLEELFSAKSVYIFPHINVDGDAMGAAAALCLALKNQKIEAAVILEDDIPDNLRFLDSNIDIIDIGSLELSDVKRASSRHISVAVDNAHEDRFPKRKELFNAADVTMAIDHHLTSKPEFDYNYIDSQAAATCQLLYRLFCNADIEIDPAMAAALLTGISTDTGNFQYSNTTAEVHIIASKLIELGADINLIYTNLYQNKSYAKLALYARAVQRTEFFEDGSIGLTYVMLSDFKELRAEENDSDGIVEEVRNIKDVEISVLIRQMEEYKYKVSLRAKFDFDVSELAKSVGNGGGHKKAAGFTYNGSLEELKQMILKRIREVKK